MGRGIPERWLDYKSVGQPIEGTRIICFKTPLNKRFNQELSLEQEFTPQTLMDLVPNLGLVINLCNTLRYYQGSELMSNEVQFCHLQLPGREIPEGEVFLRFFDIVDSFLKENDGNDKLIGIHCTHGLNRTGLLVCSYLFMKIGLNMEDIIKRFGCARGHEIENEKFREFLNSDDVKNHISGRKKVSGPKPVYRKNSNRSEIRRVDSSPYHRLPSVDLLMRHTPACNKYTVNNLNDLEINWRQCSSKSENYPNSNKFEELRNYNNSTRFVERKISNIRSDNSNYRNFNSNWRSDDNNFEINGSQDSFRTDYNPNCHSTSSFEERKIIRSDYPKSRDNFKYSVSSNNTNYRNFNLSWRSDDNNFEIDGGQNSLRNVYKSNCYSRSSFEERKIIRQDYPKTMDDFKERKIMNDRE